MSERTVYLTFTEAVARRYLRAAGVTEVEGEELGPDVSPIPGLSSVRTAAKSRQPYIDENGGLRTVSKGSRALQISGTPEAVDLLIAAATEVRFPQMPPQPTTLLRRHLR